MKGLLLLLLLFCLREAKKQDDLSDLIRHSMKNEQDYSEVSLNFDNDDS